MQVNYWSSTKKIQLKENSTENSAEKNIKENCKFNELWNFSLKQKKEKKRKILKFKELFFQTLSDKFPANCTNICETIVSIPFFLVSFL